MLTVQETLKTIDPNELISAYATRLMSDVIGLLGVPDNVTFGEFKDNKKHKASIIIDNLLNADIQEESDAILFACHRYDNDANDIVFELVEIEEISGDDWKDKAQGYCYMAEPFDKIAAYKIADTYLTKRNLVDLLVDVMYEASWFGPNQEHREEFIESLDDRINSEEEAKPIEELWKHFEDEFGWTPEIRNPEEEKIERDVNMKIYEYNRTCFLNEVANIRKSLDINNEGESK